MRKNESRQFNISVEGINCEKLYFEHLAKLINHSGRNKYNLRTCIQLFTIYVKGYEGEKCGS